MKKRYVVVLAMLGYIHSIGGCLSGTLEGSLIDSLGGNFDQFSLILFTLDKNVVRIERYGLDELACDVNRVSRQVSNSHCLYKLTLSEQGQSITDIGWGDAGIDTLVVEACRNKKKTYFGLNWSMLLAEGNSQPQDFMRSEVIIREVFNLNTADADRSPKRSIDWFSSLAIAWGLPGQELFINLILARKVQAAAAVVVPNDFLDAALDSCVELNRSHLVSTGVLVQLNNVSLMQDVKRFVSSGLQDDLHDIMLHEPSAISVVYAKLVAKIAMAQKYLYSFLWH